MARKPKARKIPLVNKEYVWELEVDDQLHTYKVFVGEDECITYEDDVECKHLKIMDKTQQEGLLQIDCKTKVLDEILPFQLENGIPYIKVEGRWTASDTTKEDRLQEKIRMYKKQSLAMCAVGACLLLYTLIEYLVTGTLSDWDFAPILGLFFFAAAAMTMVRLKNEVEAMGRKFTWKL